MHYKNEIGSKVAIWRVLYVLYLDNEKNNKGVTKVYIQWLSW